MFAKTDNINTEYMKMFKVIAVLVVAALFSVPVTAQKDSFNYQKTAVAEREPIPWTHLREADVKYAKRIVRVVDTREKMNFCLRWPKNPFSKLIYEWATIPGASGMPANTILTAYRNDSLTSFYTPEEVLERGGAEITTQIPDPYDPSMLVDTIVYEPFDHEKILKYRIMEDWFFDHKHSTFYPRIIAIAPVFKKLLSNGSEAPEAALFWFKYEDLRPLFARQPVFNRGNDAAMLSLDHFFEMRMFSSYIIKESNMFDLAISEFEEFKDNGVEALLQSENIKNKLFITEHDLWQY
jgi:gliding motility associated protien GldN